MVLKRIPLDNTRTKSRVRLSSNLFPIPGSKYNQIILLSNLTDAVSSARSIN